MPQSLIDLAFSVATMNDPELIEKFPAEKVDTYAQDLFAKGQELEVVKDVARWNEVTLSREPAPFTGKRSPATVIEGLPYEAKTAVIADIRIASDPIPLDEITSERAAQNALATETRDKRKRVRIAKELLAWQALKGSVAINPTTVPGSKVSFAFTQAVTALTPAASWQTAATLVASGEFGRLQEAYHDANGLEAKRLVIDAEVHKHLRRNTEVQALYAAYSPADKKGTVLAPIGDSFQFEGFQFDVTRAKYSQRGVGLTKYLGANALLALPGDDELRMVLGRAEGRGAIPREAIGADVGSLGGLAPNVGEYAYAYTIPEPAAVVMVFGWRGLFLLTFPEAVGYMPDVTTP